MQACFWPEAGGSYLRCTRDHCLVHREEFVWCKVSVNVAYSEAKYQFSVRNRDVLMNAQCRHILVLVNSEVCCSSSRSSLPSFVGQGGGLVCESVGKAICCHII